MPFEFFTLKIHVWKNIFVYLHCKLANMIGKLLFYGNCVHADV